MNNYCLPVIRTNCAQVLEAMNAHAEDYGFVEVWLDYIEDLDDAFVRDLIERWQGRLVVVFRRQNLGAMRMKQDRRLALLRLFDGTPVLVDVDLESQEAELNFIREHHLMVQCIASYHNYAGTPDGMELRRIVMRMEKYNPAVYKVAAMCLTEHDAVRLLGLLLSLKAKEGRRYIVLGMGQHGVVTRVFGTLWGNAMAFVPDTVADTSAPGQLTRAQFDAIMGALKG